MPSSGIKFIITFSYSVALVRQRTFADRGCHVISVMDPYCRILGLLDRSRCFLFQVAPQLYTWGWVYPIPDPLLLRKSGRAGNRTRTSGSDHQTTNAVKFIITSILTRHNGRTTWLSEFLSSCSNRPWRPIGLWDVEDPTLSRPGMGNLS
jgi:hypothetical protein